MVPAPPARGHGTGGGAECQGRRSPPLDGDGVRSRRLLEPVRHNGTISLVARAGVAVAMPLEEDWPRSEVLERMIKPWDDELLVEQKAAASHTGNHARLLAGPGTGKTLTLTRHISFLIGERDLQPDTILAITFTRAAARELRQRVTEALGEGRSPRISTLHSFALRQLLKNSSRISGLPQPLRIADDWEEQNIVLPDLKTLCEFSRKSEAQGMLNQLSADWQSLTADESDWDDRFPDPAFLGAWREHRQVYGYTLRAELVYQLKKALEQRGDFELESPIQHLLVDEYQDLNRCDLAVVERIALRGTELFIAGDDDQSIYGFRKADPTGIRRFPEDYSGATDLALQMCKRCDRGILDLGLFVARQDHRRIEKAIRSEEGRAEGEVALLRFDDQYAEATGIAHLCANLIRKRGLRADDVLILLRSDRNGAFSRPIREKLEEMNIETSAGDVANPLDSPQARAFLAFLRLAVRIEDSLAWRTLLQVWCHGVGESAVAAVYDLAHRRNESFAQTVMAAHSNKDILPTNHRARLLKGIDRVLKQLGAMFPEGSRKEYSSADELVNTVQSASTCIVSNEDERVVVLQKFERAARALESISIEELIRVIGIASEDIEQELEEGKVNILTMHRAKGLTAEAVIVAAAEDQYVPGIAGGDQIGDERRLLYVSLTRAKHHLFVTYCDRRTGRQMHTGRDGGRAPRSLTQFLVDCPYTPKDGRTFVSSYAKAASR